MALTDEGNGGMGVTMPVVPMGGYNYGGGGFGNDGFGFGGGWWIIILLLIFGGGFGFGNGFGGNDMYPWMNQQNAMASGFDHAATQTAISGIQSSITSGFGDMQTALTGGFAGVQNALCSGFAGVNAGISNGFAQAEIANNARQIANMQQGFAAQTAVTGGLTDLSSQLANCCCENRLATQGLQSVIQTENCADRAAISDGIRDILVAQTAGTQKILDMMCQNKIDEKNEKIAELQNKLNMASFQASQVAQDNYLQNALTAQTQYFLSLYPVPTPATATAA